MKVGIVVLTWNNAADTIACLEALERLEGAAGHLIVVDNGSTDDSVQVIHQRFPRLTLLQTRVNLGYAGGNNVGIRRALAEGAEIVLILNNDAILAPDAVAEMVHQVETQPDVGIAGAKVLYCEDPERIQSGGGVISRCGDCRFRFVDEPENGPSLPIDQVVAVDYVSGCALLITKACFEATGGFDERFFMYHEDIDLCYRAKRAGFQVLFVPQARVWHPRSRTDPAALRFVAYYMNRNHLLFLTKNRFSPACVLRYILFKQLPWIVNWTVNPRWRHKRPERDAVRRSLTDFFRGKVGHSYA